jgi:glycopeptide antibiotics resistance protein
MTILNILGWLILSIPFLVLFIYEVKKSGWKEALGVLGIILGMILSLVVIVSLLVVAMYLITL